MTNKELISNIYKAFIQLSIKKKKNDWKKENKEKERAIITVGRPDPEQLSRDEQQVFYRTLLVCIISFAGDSSMHSDAKQ